MSGNGSIDIDIGSVIPYVLESLLKIIGKDALTQELKSRLETQTKIATNEASWVQCMGMDHPIRITEIYQPTRLRISDEVVEFEKLLGQNKNAIIFAGPGRGKTTLLHWEYCSLLHNKHWVPIFYTLRWPNATADLIAFVKQVAFKKIPKQLAKLHIALLVDGYDEVSLDDREKVSAALREFGSLGLGNFYLTCRTFCHVVDLKATYCFIDDFTRDDALGYLHSFAKAYGASFKPEILLQELYDHGFSDFASHPLMLALVCILKSGPMPTLPRTSIGLIRRAVDTLTFRWDQAKGIYRESRVQLDGEERVRCLMRIAYHMPRSIAPEDQIRKIATEHMKLLQKQDIEVGKMLSETAQWYGILVPLSDGQWGFVHRTIYDYLAARYWVESGDFSPHRVLTWNARAAYAACLVPDATQSVVHALKVARDLYALTECLYNNAPLDPEPVAQALVDHFIRNESCFRHKATRRSLAVEMDQDFFSLASDDLLSSIVICGTSRGSNAHDLVVSYALSEFLRRGKHLSPQLSSQLRIFYGSQSFVFRVKRKSEMVIFKLADLVQGKVVVG